MLKQSLNMNKWFYSQHDEQITISPICEDSIFNDVSASVRFRFVI